MSTEEEYKTGNNLDYQQQRSFTAEKNHRDNTLLHHLNYWT